MVKFIITLVIMICLVAALAVASRADNLAVDLPVLVINQVEAEVPPTESPPGLTTDPMLPTITIFDVFVGLWTASDKKLFVGYSSKEQGAVGGPELSYPIKEISPTATWIASAFLLKGNDDYSFGLGTGLNLKAGTSSVNIEAGWTPQLGGVFGIAWCFAGHL